MARAVARVEQKIIITGADNASDAIKKAQASLGGLRKTAKKTAVDTKATGKAFTEAGDQAAGGAGKLSTALSSLGDFAGQSEGAFRTASEAAGAFDDVLTVLPGPAGLAAAAVAGLTTVIYLQSKAAQQAEARLRQAFSGALLADVLKIKDSFNLTAESAVTLGDALVDSGKSAADVHDELVNVINKAEAVGDDGSAAVAKFAASLTRGVTEAQRLTNRLKALGVAIEVANLKTAASGSFLEQFAGAAGVAADKHIGSMAAKLKAANQELKDLEAGTRGPLANYEKHLSTVNKITIGLGLSTKMAKAQASATAAQAAALEQARKKVAGITDAVKKAAAQRASVAATLKEVAQSEQTLRIEAAQTEAQEAVAENARAARAKKRAARSKARTAAQARARKEAAQAAFGLRQNVAGQRALLTYQRQDLETEGLIARARKATAKSTDAKIAAEKALIDVATRRQILEIQATKLDKPDKSARIAAVKELAAAEQRETIKGISATADAVGVAKKKAAEKQLADDHALLVRQIQPIMEAFENIGRVARAQGNIGMQQLADSLTVAVRGAVELKKNLKDIPAAVSSAAGTVGSLAGIAIDADTNRTKKALQNEKRRKLATATTEAERAAIVAEFEAKKAAAVEAAERRKAAIMAVVELARAAASYPNIPEMVAHGVAAGLFGAIAGGVIGGSSAAPVTLPGAGGFAAAGQAGGAGGGGSGGGGAGVTIVNNFNQPLTTRQHIGKAVSNALRSIDSTGHAKAKGV